jgi:hypothetical protein
LSGDIGTASAGPPDLCFLPHIRCLPDAEDTPLFAATKSAEVAKKPSHDAKKPENSAGSTDFLEA